MEPHGSVAKWDGNRLTVWDSTQGVYAIQESLARVLGLSMANVRVIGHYMGGGFGAKLELGKYTVIAALMSRTTGRPVKIFLPREDCFRITGNRPGNTITVKIGAKNDGTLTAIDYTSLGSGGAYPSGAGTSTMAAYLYRCPNLRTEDTTVCINAGRARPMRAPGFPQSAWALEQAIDELAEKLEIDPIAFRLQNLAEERPGRRRHTVHLQPACRLSGIGRGGLRLEGGPRTGRRRRRDRAGESASRHASGATPEDRRRR